MSLFHPIPPEKIIYEFHVNSTSDDFSFTRPGMLIVTNMQMLYYQKDLFKEELKLEFALPFKALKVKYKESFVKVPHISINSRKMVIYLYDNQQVDAWLKNLIYISKKFKGNPIPFPELPPPFVSKSDLDHVHSNTNTPLRIPKTLPFLKSKSKPIPQNITENEKERKISFCNYCGSAVFLGENFCQACGKQIKSENSKQ